MTPWWQNLDYELPETDLTASRRQGGKGEDWPFRHLVRALEEGETPPATGIPRGTPNHQGLYRAQLALSGQTQQAAEFMAWQLQGGGWCLTEPFAPYLDFHTSYVLADLVAADRHGDRQLREYCLEWLRWTRDLLEIFRAPDGRVIAPHPRAKAPYHYDTTDLLAAVLTDTRPSPALAAKIKRTHWFSNGRWSGWSARMLVSHAELWHPLGDRVLDFSTRRTLLSWDALETGGVIQAMPPNWGAPANPIMLSMSGNVYHGPQTASRLKSSTVSIRRPGNPIHRLTPGSQDPVLKASAEGQSVPLEAIPTGKVITFRTDPPATRLWDWRAPHLHHSRDERLRWMFAAPAELSLWVDGKPFELQVVEPE